MLTSEELTLILCLLLVAGSCW